VCNKSNRHPAGRPHGRPTVASLAATGHPGSRRGGTLARGQAVGTLTLNLSEAVTVCGRTPAAGPSKGGGQPRPYRRTGHQLQLTFISRSGAGPETAGDLAVTAVNLGTATCQGTAPLAKTAANLIAARDQTRPGTLQVRTQRRRRMGLAGSVRNPASRRAPVSRGCKVGQLDAPPQRSGHGLAARTHADDSQRTAAHREIRRAPATKRADFQLHRRGRPRTPLTWAGERAD